MCHHHQPVTTCTRTATCRRHHDVPDVQGRSYDGCLAQHWSVSHVHHDQTNSRRDKRADADFVLAITFMCCIHVVHTDRCNGSPARPRSRSRSHAHPASCNGSACTFRRAHRSMLLISLCIRHLAYLSSVQSCADHLHRMFRSLSSRAWRLPLVYRTNTITSATRVTRRTASNVAAGNRSRPSSRQHRHDGHGDVEIHAAAPRVEYPALVL